MAHRHISRGEIAALLDVFADKLQELRALVFPDDDDRPWKPMVRFGVPSLLNSTTGEFVPMAVVIPNDDIGIIPLIFTDIAGHQLAGDITGVSATCNDPTLALAEVTSDGQWVQITPLQLGGSGVCTYTDVNDNISNTVTFTIAAPNPASVAFNEAGMVLKPNPNPPAGAPGSTITGAGSGSTVSGAGGTVGGAGSTVTGAGSTVSGTGGTTVAGAGG